MIIVRFSLSPISLDPYISSISHLSCITRTLASKHSGHDYFERAEEDARIHKSKGRRSAAARFHAVVFEERRRYRTSGATDAGTLPEILRERTPRTSPAVDLRLIRDDAAGSLRDPGPVITSDQTIHKANAARGRRWSGKRVERYLRSAWLSGWLGGVDAVVAVTTKVLSKLFSRASQVEGSWKMVPNLDRGEIEMVGLRCRRERTTEERVKRENRARRTWKLHCFLLSTSPPSRQRLSIPIDRIDDKIRETEQLKVISVPQ